MSASIRVYNIFPKEMFRLNNGSSIRLRGYPGPLKPARSFDVLTSGGIVLPKAHDPETYEAPNGASMRPNTAKQQELVRKFKGASICVYSIPEGAQLPSDLILVHERDDHYAIQPNKEMLPDELNTKITDFLKASGQCFTRDEWCRKYPQATESQ